MLAFKKTKHSVFIVLLSLLMLFSGCQQQKTIKHFTFQESQSPAPTFTSQITEEIPDTISKEFSRMILEKYRPENATAKPDFSGEITDLRFTVVHREHLPATGESELIDDLLQNLTYLQIYYGYLMDG